MHVLDKRLWISLVTFTFFLLLSTSVMAQRKKVIRSQENNIIYPAKTTDICSIKRTAFQPGERIRYCAYYHWGFIWLSAGLCDMEVFNSSMNNMPTYRLNANGWTYSSYDPFFKVRDTLVAEVDTCTMIPYEAHKYAHEGNWAGEDHFFFQPSDTAVGYEVKTILKRKQTIRPPKHTYTPHCGFDILSSIYRWRNLPDSVLYADKPICIPVRLDDDEYDVYLHYKGTCDIKLHRGETYRSRYFEMSLIEGTVFNKGDYLKLWISDDANRVPLQVEAPIRVGSVKAIFQEAENLLH